MKMSKRIGRWIHSLGSLIALLGLVPLIGGCPGTFFPTGGCAADAECDDGNACTADSCAANGVCIHEPISCPPEVIDLRSATDAEIAALDVQSEITGVSTNGGAVVDFTVSTTGGAPITGIGALWEADNRFVRFTFTKLVPGTSGDPSVRVPYTRATTNNGSTGPNYDTGSSLVDHGDGSYTFTFNTDVTAVSGVTYEPTLSHRVAGQIGSGDVSLQAQNMFLDFVPAGGEVINTRNIATVTSCNECHGRLVIHGRRFITEYCVNCHTSDLAAGEGDFKVMVHKIHSAQKFEVLDDGVDYREVTYPQDVRNCRKCHNGQDEATVDGDNWKSVPNMVACGACHSDVDFETGENHPGGTQTGNSKCALCHAPDSIEDHHLTDSATPNNPSIPTDLSTFSYEISDARVDSNNELEIDLSVLRDGTPMDLLNLPSDVSSSPGFIFGYSAGPQDGIANPNDYNNLGQSAGQPASASLVDLIDAGSVRASGTSGMFTVIVPEAFPVGAKMRAVALQSRFRQVVGEETVDRPTISVVKPVTGDVERRIIVDPAKCGNCHEWLSLHGGSRIVGAASDPAQPLVCVICHNPSLSSSGRTADPSQPLQDDTVAVLGDNPLIYPERSMQLKNLVHGLHAADHRSQEYEFVRNRLNGLYYNWNEVTFPGVLNNCLTCHVEGTYELPLPDDVLPSTERTTSGDPNEDRDTILASRDSVPNGTDLISTPTAATCYHCHDSDRAVAHMEQNGGQINVLLRETLTVGADFVGVGADTLTRDEVGVAGMTEACAVCHGVDRIADLNIVHGIK